MHLHNNTLCKTTQNYLREDILSSTEECLVLCFHFLFPCQWSKITGNTSEVVFWKVLPLFSLVYFIESGLIAISFI